MLFEPFKIATTTLEQGLGIDGKTGQYAKSLYEWGMENIANKILGGPK